MVAAVMAVGSLLQVPTVHDYVLVLTHDHPHWVFAVTTIYRYLRVAA